MNPLTMQFINSVDHLITLKGELRINCPECDDTGYHLYINQHKMLYHCFKCEYKGKIATEQYADLEDYMKIFKGFRYKGTPIHFDPPIKTNSNKREKEIRQVKSLPLNRRLIEPEMRSPEIYRQFINPAYNYLESRGVTYNEVNKYDIRVSIEKSGPYKDTVIFPIYKDHKDGLEYFVCRKYNNEKPKYINAPWSKEGTLFRTSPKYKPPNYVIVEGILDAIAVCRAGYYGISLLGKSATSQQLIELSKNINNGYLIYLDNDALVNAITLKLQLGAMGVKSHILTNRFDAAALAIQNLDDLEEELSIGNNFLTKSKLQSM